jgi:hypothetical protein
MELGISVVYLHVSTVISASHEKILSCLFPYISRGQSIELGHVLPSNADFYRNSCAQSC